MNARTASTQSLSGTFKHGAGRIILLALGSVVVAAAVVAAVTVRQLAGGDSPSDVRSQANSALYPASRESVRGHVDADPLPVADGESASSTSSPANSLASRHSERTVRTTHIVASPEQAASVADAINDANVFRASIGESFMFDTVLVVRSDAEADAALEAIAYGNGILVGLGEPEERVVDLRSN